MYRLIFILVFILSITGVKSELVKMTTVDWPPFYGKGLENGGIFVALTREALKVRGHVLKVDFVSWVRALKKSKEGKYHALLGCWYTKEREKYFIFSKTNVDATPHFLSLPESTLEVKKVEDLHGLKIGLIRGFAVGSQIKEAISANKVQIMEVSFHHNLFKLLQKKRIDLIMENSSVMKAKITEKLPSNKYNLKTVGSNFFDGYLYVCWSRKKEGAKKLSEDFNKGLQTIIKNGTYERIWKKYGM